MKQRADAKRCHAFHVQPIDRKVGNLKLETLEFLQFFVQKEKIKRNNNNNKKSRYSSTRSAFKVCGAAPLLARQMAGDFLTALATPHPACALLKVV